MNILDCAYAKAREAGYIDVECLGVLDGLLVFNLVSVPTNGAPLIVGYPEFLVGMTSDDLHFDCDSKYLRFCGRCKEDTRSEDYQAFREERRALDRADLLDDEDEDDDFSLLSIDDDDMSDDDGFLISGADYIDGEYTNWHFDPDWIAWKTREAVSRFGVPEDMPVVVEETHEDNDTQSNDQECVWYLDDEYRAKTFLCLLSIVTKHLFDKPRSYLAYGPYWPAVKRILIKEGRLTGTELEPVIADIYRGERDLETLVAAELFRESSLKRNPLGETSWCLSPNHGHAWQLIDREMEVGITNARALLGFDAEDLYETPEEAVAFLSPYWNNPKDVHFYGFWRGLPVWVFVEEGKISRDRVAYGETIDTMRIAELSDAEKILSKAILTNYQLRDLEFRSGPPPFPLPQGNKS